MMETIVCKCRVITPMFSSGADQTGCEIRVPEIKAAMRFWWRAAHSNLSLDELRKRETLIFGGSGDKEARKSSFTMKVEYDQKDFKQYTQNDWNKDLTPNKNDPKNKTYTVQGSRYKKDQAVNLFDYLAFGRKNNGFKPEETKFKLTVRVDKECKRVNKRNQIEVVPDLNPVDEVKKALELFSCFGSLGAKSRNGFGRVFIDKIEVDEKPETLNRDIEKICENFVKTATNKEFPEYTAFSKKMSLFKTEKPGTWDEVLFCLGAAYREARVGKNGRTGLLNDHYTGENRQYIALPLTVMNLINREKQNPTKYDYDKKPLKRLGLERMAKQFFMIVEPEEGGFRGYILHLPFDIGKVSKRCNKQMWLDANNEMKRRLKEYKEDPKTGENSLICVIDGGEI